MSNEEKIKKLEKELNHLKDLIKSESVYMLLRFGSKSPSKSGMDNCDDNDYLELYDISIQLQKDE